MPRVSHIVLECGVCKTAARRRVEYFTDEPLSDLRCPKCRAIGYMHVLRVVVRTDEGSLISKP